MTESETDPRLPEIPEAFRALDGEDVVYDSEPEGEKLPTLEGFGKKLPIGFEDARGQTHRDFELVPWDFALEEELGEVVEKHPEMSMGQYISEVVGRGLARLGGIDVTKLKRSERRLLVYRMFFADVLALYVWIRIGALGRELRLGEFDCRGCGKAIDYVGDLLSLEVKEVARDAVEEVEVEFEYGGKRRRSISVGPLRWAFMEVDDPSVLSNPAKMKLHTIANSVAGVEGVEPGVPVVVTRDVLRTMKPRDINRVVAAVDRVSGGVVMQVEGVCPRCKRGFAEGVDWSYEDFFGRSSR